MAQVFSRGRMRLYLLKLLDEQPRHGYDILQLLQDRLGGGYEPSPGSVYPRLRRLEAGGLVTHDERGDSKVYRLTETGRAEVRERADELAVLERDIHESATKVADEDGEHIRDLERDIHESATRVADEVGEHIRHTVREVDREFQDVPAELRAYGRKPKRRLMKFTRQWPDAPEFAGPAGLVQMQLQVFQARVGALLDEATMHPDQVVDCAAVLEDAYRSIADILTGDDV
jgi:DNA-binding PadR family transcriptional regulator